MKNNLKDIKDIKILPPKTRETLMAHEIFQSLKEKGLTCVEAKATLNWAIYYIDQYLEETVLK